MTRTSSAWALAIAVVTAAALALAGQPAATSSATFGKYVIEANYSEGKMGGPWEFSQGVTVTGPDLKLTCDKLVVWPTKTGRELARAEATGKVAVTGRYTAADKTQWRVQGTAQAASYDAAAALGVLRGSVQFESVNTATGVTLTVAAEQLSYDLKTQQFRFQRGAQPVRVEWREPPTAGPQSSPPPAEEKTQ